MYSGITSDSRYIWTVLRHIYRSFSAIYANILCRHLSFWSITATMVLEDSGGFPCCFERLRLSTALHFVRPSQDGHEMRVSQVSELKAAMEFPAHIKTDRGTRRDHQIELLGYAVCPEVMKAVVAQLTNSRGRDGRI